MTIDPAAWRPPVEKVEGQGDAVVESADDQTSSADDDKRLE